MSTESFNCPNCGAPLDYKDTSASTVRCPYCQTSVVVPETLRPKPKPEPISVLPSQLYTV